MKINSRWILGVCGAVALTVLAIGQGGCHSKHGQPPNNDSSENHETLRRGLGGEPGTFDPGAAGDTFSLEVLGDLYEGLTAESPTGTVVPGVAASWTVDATGTKYAFALRHDAKWSDGAPVRAQDFVTAWRRVIDPRRASPVADNLRLIAGAEDIIAGRAPV